MNRKVQDQCSANLFAAKSYIPPTGMQEAILESNSTTTSQPIDNDNNNNNSKNAQDGKTTTFAEAGEMASLPYYMTAYSYPTSLSYATCTTSAYQESRAIQQALLEKSTQHGQGVIAQETRNGMGVGVGGIGGQKPARKKGETLVITQRKLPDGRSFPSDYEKDSLR